MNNKKQNKLIVLVVLLSVATLIVLIALRNNEITSQTTYSDENTIEITEDTFKDLDLSDIHVGDKIEYHGFLIKDVLSKLNFENAKTVKFNSRDGGGLLVSIDEINNDTVALIFDDKNETYRLIFPDDPFRNRWLKNIISIEVN